MKTTTLAVVAAFAVSALVAPVAAQPPGHFSVTFEFVTASYFDFKDGVGIADPSDENSPCTALLLGLRGIQPLAETWEVDQNMGLNINGPGVGVSNLVPPLAAPGGWLPNSGGINLGVACPIPGSGTGSLWLVWSGVNWRSVQSDSSTQLTLCSQETFASSSPGCLAIPDSSMRLWTSACNYDDARFGADYTDAKGKYLGGVPFDDPLDALQGIAPQVHFKSDQVKCDDSSAAGFDNNGWKRTVDWTDTIQDFTAGGASQTFDIIKNEAAVPNGFGPAYMAVCWQITYLDFQDPLNPTTNTAYTHDWKLILDVGLGGKHGGGAGEIIAALQRHYGGAIVGDNDVSNDGVGATAMRGFYSQDSGNPKGTDFKTAAVGVVGENGFPCKGPAIDHALKAKKPAPSI